MSRYYNDYWFTPSKAKEVKGGIKAKAGRGEMASTWWGKRWIQVLEGYGIQSRLARGKAYARKGQVTSLEVLPGEIKAKVQGSRSTPYKVSIRLKTLSKADWEMVGAAIGDQPLIAAKLLSGEMPEEAEAIVKRAGVSLFPSKAKDLMTDCSCPDWSDPCKHIAAVHYLVAEAFDQDPFLLSKLRGIEREEFLKMLGISANLSQNEKAEIVPEPLSMNTNDFWGKKNQAYRICNAASPRIPAALPKKLGSISLWRGKEDFLSRMGEIYKKASENGLAVYSGEYGAENTEKADS